MTFTLRPAQRAATPLLIGIGGPSSSGKTYSALRLAKGLAGGDMAKVAMIDTESGRGLHYAETFPTYQYGQLGPPFRPGAYQESIEFCVESGAKVVIVDSMSHEQEGVGGLLDWHEEMLDKMAGSDFKKRDRMNFPAWSKPKQAHNQFVNRVLQLPCHLIFCFRAKEKLAMVKDAKTGKSDLVPLGWQPICSDRFQYEMTMLLMLPPNAGGVPDLAIESTKLIADHQPMMRPGEPIDEALGEALGAWSSGGVETISETQAGDLLVLLRDTKADVARFKSFYHIANVEDLPAASYQEAVRKLEQKGRAAAPDGSGGR